MQVLQGFAAMVGNERPRIRLFRGEFRMKGGWTSQGITAGGTFTIGRLPALAWVKSPPESVIGAPGVSSGNAACSGFVTAGGDIQIRASSTLSAYYKFDLFHWLAD